jgi:hypothetical protein
MKNSGQSKEQFYGSWAEVLVKMWQGKILLLDVWDEGTLYESFVNHVLNNAGGDTELIRFIFEKYGIYADMGVGRDTPKGNEGDLRHGKKRKEKPWYSSVFYREVKKLAEFQAFHYGKTALWTVKNQFEGAFDKRYGEYSTKTVGSLKSQMQRGKQSERNYRNYWKRQFGDNWENFMREKGWI